MVDLTDDLTAAGMELDKLDNAALGGSVDVTISVRAAEDAQSGDWFACVFCKFLSWAIQRDHCADQLQGIPMTLGEHLKALAWLLLLSGVLLLPFVFLLHLARLL